MKKSGYSILFVLAIFMTFPYAAVAQLKAGDPIVFGVPTALGAIEGRDGWMAIQMSVEEINAKGGVLVGNTKHKLEAIPSIPESMSPELAIRFSRTFREIFSVKIARSS